MRMSLDTVSTPIAITTTLCALRRQRAVHQAEVERLTTLIANTKRDRAICSLLNTTNTNEITPA